MKKLNFYLATALTVIQLFFASVLPVAAKNTGSGGVTTGDNPTLLPSHHMFADRYSGESLRPVVATGVAVRSCDPLENAAYWRFSEAGFTLRGFHVAATGVYVNGFRFNDPLTGDSPSLLLNGLWYAASNQDYRGGVQLRGNGVGGYAGSVEIDASADAMPAGGFLNVTGSTANYPLAVEAGYASGISASGWAFSLGVGARQGENQFVRGNYTNAWNAYASAAKVLGRSHSISLTLMDIFQESTLRGASTAEAYALTGSEYYDPNWGYQSGKKRHAVISRNHQPTGMVNYRFSPSERFQLNAGVSYRFGYNGVTGLDWFETGNPSADNYTNLPGYYDGDPYLYNLALEGWRTDLNTRHLNWDGMYAINLSDRTEEGNSRYVLGENRRDPREIAVSTSVAIRGLKCTDVKFGADYRHSKTAVYKTIDDLLGGLRWPARTMGLGSLYPVDDNLLLAESVSAKGERYGYDYTAIRSDFRLWASGVYNTYNFTIGAGFEAGNVAIERDSYYNQGAHPMSSGKSGRQSYFEFKAKLGVALRIGDKHEVSLHTAYQHDAPWFMDAYLAPMVSAVAAHHGATEKTAAADLTYSYGSETARVRVTGFAAYMRDGMKNVRYFDDNHSGYANLSLSGIERLHTGVEASAEVRIFSPLTLRLAGSVGNYTYTDNPLLTMTVENTMNAVLQNAEVRYKELKTGGSPQTAAMAGLEYDLYRGWLLGADCDYYGGMYYAPNPLLRSDYAYAHHTPEEIAAIGGQEKSDDALLVGASLRKTWNIKGLGALGFHFSARNLLDDRSIRFGGYEQLQMKRDAVDASKYYRLSPRYFHLFGRSFNLALHLNF